MTQHKLIAIDLAKNVFQVCLMNKNNTVVVNKQLRRSELMAYIQKQEPTTVAMHLNWTAMITKFQKFSQICTCNTINDGAYLTDNVNIGEASRKRSLFRRYELPQTTH